MAVTDAAQIDDAKASVSSSSSLLVKPTKKWYHYLWDTFDKSPEERRFLLRLDACLLTYASLSFFSKNLDQTNMTNAYVSGMQEEIGLKGNELNYISTAWTCGYIIGQIPATLLVTRIRPSIWIPCMELIWSVLTMLISTTNSFSSVIAIRFFIGLAESAFYPAMQYVIGSWYLPEELAKRACIFHMVGMIAPMFGGFLQAGAYTGMNGVHGLSGWRWLFIIDGIITVPIALVGFLIMPDLPTTAKPSLIYNASQIEMARKRMEAIGRKPPAKFTKAKVLAFFSTWHLYFFIPLMVLFNNSFGPNSSMIFWLKYLKRYTVAQINVYPFGQNVVAVISTVTIAWWSDAVGKRWPPLLALGVMSFTTCVVLAATSIDTNIPRRWAFYYLTLGHAGGTALIYTWINELLGHDSEKRSFTLAACSMMSNVFQAWLPIVLFPVTQQPRVLRGNIATAGLTIGFVIFTFIVLALENRDKRNKLVAADRERAQPSQAQTAERDDTDADSKADADSKRDTSEWVGAQSALPGLAA